jgi:hypothetical protein
LRDTGVENYEKYAELTRAGDWAGICKINGVPYDTFGTRKEIKVLPKYLEPGEVVFAISSGLMSQSETSNTSDSGLNTWLVVLTSDRILFLDAALLTSSVDTQSIRHDRVQAVSASQGWVLGKIMVDLGARVVIIDNAVKASVAIFAQLANRWHKELETRKASQPVVQIPERHASEDLVSKLERLAALHASGTLSSPEFAAAKAKLLGGA